MITLHYAVRRKEHPRHIVSLAGDLDYFNVGMVREVLAPIRGNTVIDLTLVRFLDGAVMAELARVARRAAPDEVVLVVSSPNIRRLLRLVGVGRLFRIVNHPRDA